MLRDGGATDATESCCDVPCGGLAVPQKSKDRATSRVRDGVQSVVNRGTCCHTQSVSNCLHVCNTLRGWLG